MDSVHRDLLSKLLQAVSEKIRLGQPIYNKLGKGIRKSQALQELKTTYRKFWDAFLQILASVCGSVYQVELSHINFKCPLFSGSVFAQEKLKIAILKNNKFKVEVEKLASSEVASDDKSSSASDRVRSYRV
jgi:hypothetical protein